MYLSLWLSPHKSRRTKFSVILSEFEASLGHIAEGSWEHAKAVGNRNEVTGVLTGKTELKHVGDELHSKWGDKASIRKAG